MRRLRAQLDADSTTSTAAADEIQALREQVEQLTEDLDNMTRAYQSVNRYDY